MPYRKTGQTRSPRFKIRQDLSGGSTSRIIAMPLFYSISEGTAFGVISYVVINLICGNRKQITPLMFVLAVLFVCKYIFL